MLSFLSSLNYFEVTIFTQSPIRKLDKIRASHNDLKKWYFKIWNKYNCVGLFWTPLRREMSQCMSTKWLMLIVVCQPSVFPRIESTVTLSHCHTVVHSLVDSVCIVCIVCIAGCGFLQLLGPEWGDQHQVQLAGAGDAHWRPCDPLHQQGWWVPHS